MIRTEREELLRCLTSWSMIPEEIKGDNGREFMKHARLLYNCQKTGKVVFGREGGYKLVYFRPHIAHQMLPRLEQVGKPRPGTVLDESFYKETAELFHLRPDAIKSVQHTDDGLEIIVSKDSLNYYGRVCLPYANR